MRYVDLPTVLQPPRVVSVDALRGLNMFWIMGFDGAMEALAQITDSKGATVSAVGSFFGTQFEHVDWEGLHFYDLIFPLFIFLAGVSIVLSLPRLVEREGLAKTYLRIVRRSLLLYAMGVLAYGGISGHWADVRLLGILQRIAICYLITAVLFLNCNLRGLLAATVVILGGYWALLTFVPVPGVGAGSFAPDANLTNWIDRSFLPGRLWDVTRDPEGLLSTLPAVGTCLLGVFAGLVLNDTRLSETKKTLWLGAAGLALLAAGYLWALQFPLIKAIWTSSFVLVAAGFSALMLAAMHQIVDVWQWRGWATIFIWIGANALALYFLNDIANFYSAAARLVGGDFADTLDRVIGPGAGGLAIHVVMIALAVALAGFLYRNKIFIRV
ncbi:MAG TPA: heparan-alpha-glucosaminide N-acetyltransferase domain-containing protein [Xanthobacteraceae bacterium]|nr:heparan-alpha-glucosaminide N-acetyltransferase domain-containing protein [Xanthobacteraceae bacterium]